MKKTLFFAMGLFSITAIAQTDPYQGRVGINTQSPSATMNIKTRDDVQTPKNLELENQAGNKLVTVLNNGNVGIGVDNPNNLLHIKNGNSYVEEGNHISIRSDKDTFALLGIDGGLELYRNPNNTNLTDNLTYGYLDFKNNPTNDYNIRIGARNEDNEDFFYFKDYTGNLAVTIGVTDPKMSIGEIARKEALNVAGNINLSGVIKLQSQNISNTTACENGNFAYGSDDNFYACKGGTWKLIQLLD